MRTVEGDDIISIHSPLAGRDDNAEVKITGTLVISIHSPLAGRDWIMEEAKND